MYSSPGPILQQPTQLTEKPRMQGDCAWHSLSAEHYAECNLRALLPCLLLPLTACTVTFLCWEEKAKAVVQHVVASPAEGAQVYSFLSLTAESLLFMKEEI